MTLKKSLTALTVAAATTAMALPMAVAAPDQGAPVQLAACNPCAAKAAAHPCKAKNPCAAKK